MTRILTTPAILLAATIVASTGAFSSAVPVPHDPEHEMFYDDLMPYGDWIEIESGIVVWRPGFVYDDWRPYSVGRWVWTRHGWYWLSSEPFGWAVFHYGRWSHHPRFGWIWHPGRVWGPAWVEWRYNDAYIGWAPLPPIAVFHVTFGIRFTRHWVAPVNSWCFIPYGSFSSTRYRDYYVTGEGVRRIIGTTRRGRTTTIERDVIVNRGIERGAVERRGSIRVDRYDIREGSSVRSDRVRGREIEVYRPEVFRNRSGTGSRGERVQRPSLLGPDSRDQGNRERESYTRPQPQRRDVEMRPARPDVPDRRIAPNLRSRPGRSAPSSPPRTGGTRQGRSRDN